MACTVPTRWIVIFVTFVGFVFNFGLRITMNIALVAMVNFTAIPKEVTEDSQDETDGGSCKTASDTHVLEDQSTSIGIINASSHAGSTDNNFHFEGPFVWDETQQGAILASFYWGYICTQLLGGRLSEHFGPKRVLLGSLTLAAVFTIAMPWVAPWGVGWIIAMRILQGLSEGPTYPTMNVIVARWAVPHERSRMLAIVYVGGMVGGLLVMYLGGLIIPAWGYQSIFVVSGAGCLVWAAAFAALASDGPADHPRIEAAELALYPAAAAATKATTERKSSTHVDNPKTTHPVPWKGLFTNPGVWAAIVGCTTKGWCLAVTLMMPVYLKAALAFDVESSGFYSALPYAGRVTIPIGISFVADYAIKHNLMSRTRVRKVAASIDFFGNAICFLAVSLVGCQYSAAIVALAVGSSLGGASYSGSDACGMEMSPTFSGTIGGLASSGFSIGSMISPLAAGLILQGGQTSLSRWAVVYQLASGLCFAVGVIFWIIGTADRQKFDPEERTELANRDRDSSEVCSGLVLNSCGKI